jgi:hypothetical protein
MLVASSPDAASNENLSYVFGSFGLPDGMRSYIFVGFAKC